MRALIEATYKNDGCLAYDVGEDPFDPGLLRFSELWPDHESLARHLQAPHIEPLLERKFTAYDLSGSRSV